MRKPHIHSNILWVTLSSIINVSISRTRLLIFPHLTSVTLITTSFIEVCATVTDNGPGAREGYLRFLDAYLNK